ncbi:hypothetical protein BGW80DRAFT_1341266 [Lactifluus volemus]|nr:hypothetical protein BGW80DRAFT_1341266 [Lactifluus volemus]
MRESVMRLSVILISCSIRSAYSGFTETFTAGRSPGSLPNSERHSFSYCSCATSSADCDFAASSSASKSFLTARTISSNLVNTTTTGDFPMYRTSSTSTSTIPSVVSIHTQIASNRVDSSALGPVRPVMKSRITCRPVPSSDRNTGDSWNMSSGIPDERCSVSMSYPKSSCDIAVVVRLRMVLMSDNLPEPRFPTTRILDLELSESAFC